jgi:NTE family protein
VLLIPDTRPYGSSSFAAAAELIAAGELSARKKLPELRALAEKLKKFPPRPAPLDLAHAQAGKRLQVVEIKISGLEQVTPERTDESLQLTAPVWLTSAEIKSAVLRLIGSGFFERVTYTLVPAAGEGLRLQLQVTENHSDALKVGLGYDSDTQSALLFNGTFRNALVEGSTIGLDAKLGENAAFHGKRFVPFGFRTGLGFTTEIRYDRFQLESAESPGNDNDGQSLVSRNFQDYALNLGLQKDFANTITLGADVGKEIASWQSDESTDRFGNQNVDFLIYRGFVHADTLDRTQFPCSGFSGLAEVRRVTRELEINASPAMTPFFQYKAGFLGVVPVQERVSLFAGGTLGVADATEVPFAQQMHLGGIFDYDPHQISFAGLNFMERSANALWVARAGVQVETWPDIYVVAQANAGRLEDSFRRLFGSGSTLFGGALTLGAISPIGPLELSLVGTQNAKTLGVHFSLGHRF